MRHHSTTLVMRHGAPFRMHTPCYCGLADAMPCLASSRQEYNENVTVLLTVEARDAHAMLEGGLPRRVVLQYAPLDTAPVVARFLAHWKPQAGVFLVCGTAGRMLRLFLTTFAEELDFEMCSSHLLWCLPALSRGLIASWLSWGQLTHLSLGRHCEAQVCHSPPAQCKVPG